MIISSVVLIDILIITSPVTYAYLQNKWQPYNFVRLPFLNNIKVKVTTYL